MQNAGFPVFKTKIEMFTLFFITLTGDLKSITMQRWVDMSLEEHMGMI